MVIRVCVVTAILLAFCHRLCKLDSKTVLDSDLELNTFRTVSL